MRFAQIQGNDELKKTLANMIDTGHIPHAILFHEDDGGGAFPLCLAFLQYLYCKHRDAHDSCGTCPLCNRISKLLYPDIHLIIPTAAGQLSDSYLPAVRSLLASNPSFCEAELLAALKIEGKNSIIAVAEAKRLLDKLSLTSLEGSYRSVIIYLPEKMSVETANKLLKMIEEPPAMTQFLLITHRPEKLLTTISSRCQRIRLAPLNRQAGLPSFEQPELWFELVKFLAAKDLSACLELVDNLAALSSRESAKAFCAFASENVRRIFLAQQGISTADDEQARYAAILPKTFPRKALSALDKAQVLIERNVNLKLLFNDLIDRLYISL